MKAPSRATTHQSLTHLGSMALILATGQDLMSFGHSEILVCPGDEVTLFNGCCMDIGRDMAKRVDVQFV